MTTWKWFQVLGVHNLHSLYLAVYCFINTTLEYESSSFMNAVPLLAEDAHEASSD